MGVPRSVGQTVLQPPQRSTSLLTLASQPSAATPLQSAQPGAQLSTQPPPLQAPLSLGRLGPQEVPSATWRSAGHAAALPVQVSATSHSPVAGLQAVPAGRNWSAGQVQAAPSQVSATSHAPADARQVVPAGSRALVGQV
jgi:hypothetical protein